MAEKALELLKWYVSPSNNHDIEPAVVGGILKSLSKAKAIEVLEELMGEDIEFACSVLSEMGSDKAEPLETDVLEGAERMTNATTMLKWFRAKIGLSPL